jgi:signal transduction histidine kinase
VRIWALLRNTTRSLLQALSPRTVAGSIIIPIVLVTIVAGSVAVVVSTQRLSTTAAEAAEVRLDAGATQAAEQIGALLARSLGDAVVVSQNPIITSEEATPIEKLTEMKKIQNMFGTFEYIALVNTEGEVIISTDPTYNADWVTNNLFQNAAKGVPSMSDERVSSGPHNIIIQIASPVIAHDDAAVTSVLIANLNMEYIWQIIDRVRFGNTGYVCLINQSGEIIAGPDKAQLFKKIVFVNDSDKMPPEHQLIQYKENGTAMCAVIAGVNLKVPWTGTKWSFVGIMPAAEAFATANDATRLFWIVMGILLVLFILVGLVLGRNISSKIRKLAKGTSEIAKGHLSHRLPSMRPSELGQLAESFNTMATQLEVSAAEIARWNAHLKDEIEIKTRELERIMAGKIQSERLSAMGYIAASAAHELNAPLTAIEGYAQLGIKELEKEHASEDINRSLANASNYFKQIAKELQRSKNIIRKLLSFVRYSKTDDESIDINQVLSDTLSIAGHHLELNRVEPVTRLGSNLPAVTGNAQKLQQVFLNIILSAQRAMPQGGKLTVETRSDREQARAEVLFSYPGEVILPSSLDEVSEPSPAHTLQGEESNLDFSVTQDIIKQLNGEITIRSEAGSGTTFMISLPGSVR